jgi:hypothetical protein
MNISPYSKMYKFKWIKELKNIWIICCYDVVFVNCHYEIIKYEYSCFFEIYWFEKYEYDNKQLFWDEKDFKIDEYVSDESARLLNICVETLKSRKNLLIRLEYSWRLWI